MNRIQVVTIALIIVVVGLSREHGLAQAIPPCANDLASCPDRGCADLETDEALVNQAKRRMPPMGVPIRLVLDDFDQLQSQADQLVGQKVSLNQSARNRLQNLKLKSSDRRVAEGDLVEVVGFLTGFPHRPKVSGPESVNCRLAGMGNNDFHIPLVRHPEDTEFKGVVVEMIPQGRLDGWTVRKLKRVTQEGRPVVVRGQLFYDNSHAVNDDSDDVKGNDPKRFSLWEVHPVTEFYVCVTANKKCDLKKVKGPQWELLEKLAD